MYCFLSLKMTDDDELRRADLVKGHLSALCKSYKRQKTQKGREMLVRKSIEGGFSHIEAVAQFRDDPKIVEAIETNARSLLHGHHSKTQYNMCLGLLSARLMLL